MSRLILFLPLSLLACATTGTDHSAWKHNSVNANHQHDHEPTHSEQDGWDIRGITDCDAHVDPAFSSH